MISYDEFKSELFERMKGAAPPQMELRVTSILKNNDILMDSVCFCSKESSSQLQRIVYVYPYYLEFQKGKLSIDDICKIICRILTLEISTTAFDISSLYSFEEARPHIMPAVISYEHNKCRLDDIVYRQYLDFAVIYRYMVPRIGDNSGAITISNQLLSIWGITEEDLYLMAMDNLKNEQWIYASLDDMVKEMMGSSDYCIDENLIESSSHLYVITNSVKHFGASVFLSPDVFDNFMDTYNIDSPGLFILPSSLHEIIAIPSSNDVDSSELKQIVCNVNSTVSVKSDILTDSVYFYDRKQATVTIIE